MGVLAPLCFLLAFTQALAALTSLAESKQIAAESAIRKSPKNSDLYNDLALAYVDRARETSDPKYYVKAETALADFLRLAPGNLSGQKIRVRIFLGRHEYDAALDLAKTLNDRVPDDVSIYGLVAEAAIELGDYKQAESAAQWMLNLRPPTPVSLERAAKLRELFGDVEGALEFLNSARRMTSSRDPGEQVRILVEMARLSFVTGKVEPAEKLVNQALVVLPEYPPAIAVLAQIRSAQQRHAEAIELWRGQCQAVPHPRNYYGLAEALEQAGRQEETRAAYTEFEKRARNLVSAPDNANRELIFYYAGYAGNSKEALRLSQLEISRRHDVYTRDSHAWALYADRQYREALRQINLALAVGIRDSQILYRAGAIHAALQEPAAAAGYWQQSLALNPLSTAARQALARSVSVNGTSSR